MKVRKVGDILFIPRPDAKTEAELDAQYERVGRLKWKESVVDNQPELEFEDADDTPMAD